MTPQKLQFSARAAWALAIQQHDVISREQLLAIGLSTDAIRHRLERGRLFPLWRGVYAVGRPTVSRLGWWMAAVLACGPEAALSHDSGAALWRIGMERLSAIQVSVPLHVFRRRPGIDVHRRPLLVVTSRYGIPVTVPALTIVDAAGRLGRNSVERMINEADQLDLIDPEALRVALDELRGRRGTAALRRILDRRTFRLSDSDLERRMRPIIRRVGLPPPDLHRYENSYRVDFIWRDLGLVVETDGLRYHRTPAQQAWDAVRDQTHHVAGLLPLRFTHEQVRYEAEYVERTLAKVVARLRADREH